MSDLSQVEADQVQSANQAGCHVVVFVHGLWLLPSSWDRWRTRFEGAGYLTIAPSWPDDPNTVEEANRHPEVMAHKTIGQIADHFEYLISKLDSKPAIIGHSFGGLLTQILAGRGVSAASVAIDPAPFRGVLPLPISALKSASPVIGNPANHGRAVPLTYDQFQICIRQCGQRRRGQRTLCNLCRPRLRRSPVSSSHRKSQSLDRGEGQFQKPRSWAPSHYRWGEGQHGALGDSECLVQEAEAQSWRDRDSEDYQPWTLTND